MVANELKIIDFTSAVRSAPINYNFQIIKGWMERERLRTGGYGLVEGFDMTYTHDFVVHISEGILIDHNGDEIMVPALAENCGMPRYETVTEKVIVDNTGTITLTHKMYSPMRLGIIKYVPPTTQKRPTLDEVKIQDAITLEKISPLTIIDNKITVSDHWKGVAVMVTYHYCNDRIDAFLVDENGKYTREIGINSESPSAADVDLGKRFLIGFAHWIIGESISVEFIIDERTYRKVYVDKMNRLYLNGKLYTDPKWIYFVEPENPQPNDVWYDYKTNTLNVYVYDNGEYHWLTMNDMSCVPVREVKMWTEKNMPDDCQTFLFNDDELNYRFVPNTNALEIIIDQEVVMADQFTEIVQQGAKPYLSAGIGFKLIEPLDRKTVVQCIVHHSVKSGKLDGVFKRAAVFTSENFIIQTDANKNKIFHTDLPYVIGNGQLEVYQNGCRLIPKQDFIEMVNDTQIATAADKDKQTHTFKVTLSDSRLKSGDTIMYKISRFVWSYDQLDTMMKEIENKADTALKKENDINKRIDNLTTNTNSRIKDLDNKIANLTNTVKTMSNYRLKSQKITKSDLDSSVLNALVKNTEVFTFNAAAVNVIKNVTQSDIIIAACINSNSSRILRKNIDYSLSFNGNNATLNVYSGFKSPNNTIYVTLIRLGG